MGCFLNAVTLKRAYHKYGLGHVVLLLSYGGYLVCFAAAYYAIENKPSTGYYGKLSRKTAAIRNRFVKNDLIPEIFNNTKLLLFIHGHKSQYMTKILTEKLALYERRQHFKPAMPVLQCTFTNAMLYIYPKTFPRIYAMGQHDTFYVTTSVLIFKPVIAIKMIKLNTQLQAFSCMTTIGYSYIYPLTKAGRILSIAGSVMGIPFTIIVIKDLEYLLVKLLSYPCIVFAQIWYMFRFCTLSAVDENETEGKIASSQLKYDKANYRISTAERLLLMPIMVAVMALLGWISVGCALCHIYNPHIESHLLVFFVFNSLSTIGVGGINIGKDPYVFVVLFLYILWGLAIISVFINLIHTKFSRQYWLPGHAYQPLNLNRVADGMATVESFDEDCTYANEPPIYRYTTLGIFQAEDRCPVLHQMRKNEILKDKCTQTPFEASVPLLSRDPTPIPFIPINTDMTTSHDDVNSLVVETYVGRPARLIPPLCTTESELKY